MLVAMIGVGLALGTLLLLPLVISGEAGSPPIPLPTALPAALWLAWTFMADTGAHADELHDASAWARLVGALVSALGILLGATVVALIVEAVHEKVASLSAGSLRVPESGHVCIFGWSARAVPLIIELCEANASAGGGVIVVVAESRTKRQMEEEAAFAQRRGDDGLRGTRVLFRHGSPHLLPTLHAVRAHAAKAIVVLSDPTIGANAADAHTLRTVLALRTLADPPRGHVVAEVNMIDTEPALQLIGGNLVEPVVVDVLVGRLLVVCAQNPGLSACYEALLGFSGDELYFKAWPQLDGKTFGHALRAFPDAVPVGVKRAAPPPAVADQRGSDEQHADAAGQRSNTDARARAAAALAEPSQLVLNPPDDYVLQPGDELLVIAEDDNSYELPSGALAEALPAHVPQPRKAAPQQPQQLLIVGWRRDLPAMLQNLAEIVAAGSVVRARRGLARGARWPAAAQRTRSGTGAHRPFLRRSYAHRPPRPPRRAHRALAGARLWRGAVRCARASVH